MIFQHPEFLYYMLPPLFILFFLLLTQKETQEHFFSKEVMDKLRVSANTLTLKARNALFFLMGFFIIIALAGPVINEGEVEIKAKSADIMIALDISDSMLAQDVYPNRLKLAKKKALELLKAAPNERIGIIAFAKNSYLVSPLSFDHGAVSFLLDKLNTDSITEKGTDFLSMLNVVENSIKSKSKKYLLILSDGGDKSDFTQEIEYAKEQGIVVFVLGVGTQKGAPIKLKDGSFIKHNGDIIVSKLNENIAEFATKSGGVYIQSVKSVQDIKAMLREIDAKSEEKELKSEKIQRFIPLFYYPVGMALLLLLIATSSMSKRSSVKLPSLFLLFGVLFNTPNVEAGLLDFVELDKAKKAYESAEYEKASAIYTQHAEVSQNPQSYYNAGNSLYKQEKYKEAIESYQKARFESDELRAKNAANIANSYVKQGKEENLKKAVESYEKSLKIKEDKETRENLNAVKKELERQKKEKEKKKQNDKDKKDDKNKDDKKEEQKKDKDSKDKDDKPKDSKDEKSEDKEGEKSEEEQDKDDEGKKSDKKSNKSKEPKDAKDEESKSDKGDENNETKEEEKPKLQEMKKDDDNKSKHEAQPMPQTPSSAKMSDAEEAKWIGKLNQQKNSFMYRLDKQKPIKDNSDEKPW